MIWSIRIISNQIRLNQCKNHNESCCLSEIDNGTRLKSSDFKYQYIAVVIIDSFITHRNKGVVLSGNFPRETIAPYTSVTGFLTGVFYHQLFFYSNKQPVTIMDNVSSGVKYKVHIFNIFHTSKEELNSVLLDNRISEYKFVV